MNAAVIFDMDGVILDSEAPYVECWKAVGEEYGLRDVVEMSHRIIGVNEEKSRSLSRRQPRALRTRSPKPSREADQPLRNKLRGHNHG